LIDRYSRYTVLSEVNKVKFLSLELEGTQLPYFKKEEIEAQRVE
jgi:polynucleotide 5'-kinase involved in rRNA processing